MPKRYKKNIKIDKFGRKIYTHTGKLVNPKEQLPPHKDPSHIDNFSGGPDGYTEYYRYGKIQYYGDYDGIDSSKIDKYSGHDITEETIKK